jgi:hypothetical protein
MIDSFELTVKLRELADKGLLSHLSVYAQWGAHNSPTVFHASVITIHGQGHHDSTDIVEAVLTAMEKAPKQAKRHTSARVNPDPAPAVEARSSTHLVEAPAQTPAPVVSKPVKPQAQQTTGKLQRVAGPVVPNLKDLWA